jgi:hypothetical protein
MRFSKMKTLAEYAPDVKNTRGLDQVLVPFDLALSSRLLSSRAGDIHRGPELHAGKTPSTNRIVAVIDKTTF